MLEIIEPAATTALTTLDRVKQTLGINDDVDDEYLEMLINEQSDYVCAYLNVAAARDGSRTLGRETLTETFLPSARPRLVLSRVPVVSITEIVVNANNVPVDPLDYDFDGATGEVYHGTSLAWSHWWLSFSRVSVTYVAGWLLPGEDGRNLPGPIEGGTVSLISTSRAGRGRDPLAKSEDIPGVLRTEYWTGPVGYGGTAASGMPPEIASRLSPYRRYVV